MDANAHCELGFQAWQEWRLDDANRHFSAAIELTPDFAPAYTGRGYVHFRDGRYEQAKEDFTLAISLDALDGDAWKGRADTLQIQARFHRAISDYTEAIRISSQTAEYFHRRADAYSALGDIEKAIEDYRTAIALEIDNPVPHYLLAHCLSAKTAHLEAIEHYREAVRIDPENLDSFIYSDYAWILATCPEDEGRNPSEALRLAEHACEINDWSDESSLSALAAAHAAAGNFEKAIRWLGEAIKHTEEDRLDVQNQRLELLQAGKPLPFEPGL